MDRDSSGLTIIRAIAAFPASHIPSLEGRLPVHIALQCMGSIALFSCDSEKLRLTVPLNLSGKHTCLSL